MTVEPIPLGDADRVSRILVVDDETQLVSLVAYALRSAGMEVLAAHDGSEALRLAAEHRIDLVVLDVMLPDMSGFELCTTLRRRGATPVVFLTARSDQADVIAGLEAGGDDYLAKPFSIEELLLRIRAVLRRTARVATVVTAGPLRMNLDTHETWVRDLRVDLTPLEFRFLAFLIQERARVVPPAELVGEVWGVADLGAHDTLVKTTVYRLRQKLGDASDGGVEIRNVRGVGYQIRCGTED